MIDTTMRDNFEYNVFISYKSQDKRWAKWLKRRLDSFSCKQICPNPEYPLREVFLDSNNMGVSPLRDSAIKTNVGNSKYLICLCTEQYGGEWVETEIKDFQESCAARGVQWDYWVIPIYIGKHPCIPESIKHIKAVTIDGFLSFYQKEYAIAMVAAKIIGLPDPDKIFNYLRVRRNFIMGLWTLLLLAFVVAGVCVWEFNRTRTEFYCDYTEGHYVKNSDNEWFRGIGHITPKEARKSLYCYRFEYKRIPFGQPNMGKWQLKRVVCQNRYDHTVPDTLHMSPFICSPDMRLSYVPSNGYYCVGQVSCFDENEQLQRIMYISGEKCDKLDFKDYRTELAFMPQTLADFPTPLMERLGNKYCNITHYEIARDSNDVVCEVRFKASNGLREPYVYDSRGHYGYKTYCDSLGRIRYMAYMRCDGQRPYLVACFYNQYQLRRKSLYSKTRRQPILVRDFLYEYVRDSVKTIDINYIDTTMVVTECCYQDGLLKEKKVRRALDLVILGDKLYPENGKWVQEENKRLLYNKNFQPVRIVYLDSHDKPKYEALNYYDKDKLLRHTVCTNHYALPSPEGSFSRCDYFYDDCKRVEEKHLFLGGKDYYVKYEYENNRIVAIKYYDSSHALASIATYQQTLGIDNTERGALAAIVDLIQCKSYKQGDLFEGDTLCTFFGKFPLYGTYAQRIFKYDDLGNVTKVVYQNEKGEDQVVMEEDILDSGSVPRFKAYITNKQKQKFCFFFDSFTNGGRGQNQDDPFNEVLCDMVWGMLMTE